MFGVAAVILCWSGIAHPNHPPPSVDNIVSAGTVKIVHDVHRLVTRATQGLEGNVMRRVAFLVAFGKCGVPVCQIVYLGLFDEPQHASDPTVKSWIRRYVESLYGSFG